jgi:hypothetical protein
MKIPLPPMPRWFDQFLDWFNIDIGPKVWKFQPRRLDIIIVIMGIVAVVIDGSFYHSWTYALVMEPLFVIFGLMSSIWFARGTS